jgi:hypothetical protein
MDKHVTSMGHTGGPKVLTTNPVYEGASPAQSGEAHARGDPSVAPVNLQTGVVPAT